MKNSHHCLAIIPARGGSKRIPRKNIKDFHGKPLIAYSIQCALQSKLFQRIMVSTDCPEIADIANRYGASTPFLRPSSLSDDQTSVRPVIEHTLEMLKSQGETYHYRCVLYPTAPLLEVYYLKKGLEVLQTANAAHTFAATSMPFPIQRTFRIMPNGRCLMFWPEHAQTRSQDLETAYQDAGQFCWTNHLHPHASASILGEESIPILLPRHLVQDVDTPEDWEQAKRLYQIKTSVVVV